MSTLSQVSEQTEHPVFLHKHKQNFGSTTSLQFGSWLNLQGFQNRPNTLYFCTSTANKTRKMCVPTSFQRLFPRLEQQMLTCERTFNFGLRRLFPPIPDLHAHINEGRRLRRRVARRRRERLRKERGDRLKSLFTNIDDDYF